MSVSVSYRLDEGLKQGVAARAAEEGIAEAALVSRMLAEGLKTAAHPGVVYRGGPSGRRAGLAGGPDLSEVVTAVRHAPGRGDGKVIQAAEQLGLPDHLVRLALAFASVHPDEVEARISDNEAAAARVRASDAQQRRFLAS